MTSPSWYPSEYYIQPHYTTMPAYLRFEDAIAPALEGKRLAFWRRCRTAGLAQWAELGVEFRIKERTSRMNYPNRVTLEFADDVPPQLGAWHYFEDPAVGPVGDGHDWIHFLRSYFEQQYQAARSAQPIVYRVAHEFGHSLGFGHGGDGIMDQTPYHPLVSPEELVAAKDYWRIP